MSTTLGLGKNDRPPYGLQTAGRWIQQVRSEAWRMVTSVPEQNMLESLWDFPAECIHDLDVVS